MFVQEEPFSSGDKPPDNGLNPGESIWITVQTPGPETPEPVQACPFEFIYKRQKVNSVKITFFMCLFFFGLELMIQSYRMN